MTPRPGVTEVAGADLLDSTARQILLQRLLWPSPPAYAHLPVASNAPARSSQQTLARPSGDGGDPARVLVDARISRPAASARACRRRAWRPWAWARQHWSMVCVPRRRSRAGALRYG